MTDKKLIPFNLERALAGDPVVTRDGRKVLKVVHFPIVTDELKVYAAIENENNKISCYSFHEDGSFWGAKQSDLFMAPKTKTYFVRIYKDDIRGLHASLPYDYSIPDLPPVDWKLNLIKIISFELDDE